MLPGHDFVNNDADPADDNGHGTEVAGIAAARGDNQFGIAGVDWKASILPVKVLGADGSGTDANIAAGITWAADNGASVINLSLGGPGQSAVLQSAIDYALSKDAVVVAAAGNEASSQAQYPAAASGVVAVSATDWGGNLAWFSSYGHWVDLAAPGTSLMTTGGDSIYARVSGSSFAAPLVAGVAALVRSVHPTWTQAEVVCDLAHSAHDLGSPGIDSQFGYGEVDAA